MCFSVIRIGYLIDTARFAGRFSKSKSYEVTLYIRAEQRFSSDLIGRAVSYMTICKPLKAANITFRRPATKLATLAISASKHGGHFTVDK